MLKRTHFWKQFVARNKNYIVTVENKNIDPYQVPSEMFNCDFMSIGVRNKSQITLHEYKESMFCDEGGEDEMDEMEEKEEEQSEK